MLYGSCPTSTISITSQCQDKMFFGSYESTDVDAIGYSTYEMIGNSDFKLAFNSTSEVRGWTFYILLLESIVLIFCDVHVWCSCRQKAMKYLTAWSR